MRTLAILLLFCSVAWADTVSLGTVNMTEDQRNNMGGLIKGKILSIKCAGNQCTAETTGPLNNGEINSLVNNLENQVVSENAEEAQLRTKLGITKRELKVLRGRT